MTDSNQVIGEEAGLCFFCTNEDDLMKIVDSILRQTKEPLDIDERKNSSAQVYYSCDKTWRAGNHGELIEGYYFDHEFSFDSIGFICECEDSDFHSVSSCFLHGFFCQKLRAFAQDSLLLFFGWRKATVDRLAHHAYPLV